MTTLLSTSWRWIHRLGTLERGACVVLLSLIVVSMTVQIFTRYLLGQPLVWVEEAAGYSFIWLVFLGASAGFKELRHIRIETFVARLPMRPQRLFRGLIYLLCTVAALIVAWYAWDIMEIESRSSTIALPLELPRHLFYSVPLCVATLSIALTGLYLITAYWTSAFTGLPIDAEGAVIERRRLDEELINH